MMVMMVVLPQAVEIMKPVLEKYPTPEDHFAPDQMGKYRHVSIKACQLRLRNEAARVGSLHSETRLAACKCDTFCGAGLMQFLAACQKHQDEDIKKIADSLKAKFIPEALVRQQNVSVCLVSSRSFN